MVSKVKAHKINSNKKTNYSKKHVFERQEHLLHKHHSLENKIEHTHHPIHHEPKYNINFMLVMLVGIVALVSIIVMIVGTSQMNYNNNDSFGQAITVVNNAEIIADLNSGTSFNNEDNMGAVYVNDPFTAELAISGGTGPYYITSVKCDGDEKLDAELSVSSYDQLCSFDSKGTHTITITGYDSSVRYEEICHTKEANINAAVVGTTCTTKEISDPKTFTATWTVKVEEKIVLKPSILTPSKTSIPSGNSITYTLNYYETTEYDRFDLNCGNGETVEMTLYIPVTSHKKPAATANVVAEGTYRATCTYNTSETKTFTAKAYGIDLNNRLTAKVVNPRISRTLIATSTPVKVIVLTVAPTCPLIPTYPDKDIFCPNGKIVANYEKINTLTCVVEYECQNSILTPSKTSIPSGNSITYTLNYYGTTEYDRFDLNCGNGETVEMTLYIPVTSHKKPAMTAAVVAEGTYRATCTYNTSETKTFTAKAYGIDLNNRLTAKVVNPRISRTLIATSTPVEVIAITIAPVALTAKITELPPTTYINSNIDATGYVYGGEAPYTLIRHTCGNEIVANSNIVKRDLRDVTMKVAQEITTPETNIYTSTTESTIYPKYCVYSTLGTYVLNFTVKDNKGDISSVTETIKVSLKPAVLEAIPNPAVESAQIKFIFTLNNGVIPYQDVMLDCGDGTLIKEMSLVSGTDNKFEGICIYADSGHYKAIATAKDAGTMININNKLTVAAVSTRRLVRQTLSASTTVTILPTTILQGSAKITPLNNEVEYVLTLNAGTLSYHDAKLDCGDGSGYNAMEAVSGSSSNNKFKATCTYTKPGKYTIRAQVYDSSGKFRHIDNKVTADATAKISNDKLFTSETTITVMSSKAVLTASTNRVSLNKKIEFILTISGGVLPYHNVRLNCGDGSGSKPMELIPGTENQFKALCKYSEQKFYNATAIAYDSRTRNTKATAKVVNTLSNEEYIASTIVQALDSNFILSSLDPDQIVLINEVAVFTLNAGEIEPSLIQLYCGNGETTSMRQIISSVGDYLYEGACSYDERGEYGVLAEIKYINSTDSNTIITNSNTLDLIVLNQISASLDIQTREPNIYGENILFRLYVEGGLMPYYGVEIDCGNNEVISMDEDNLLLNESYSEEMKIYSGTCKYLIADSIASYTATATGIDSLSDKFKAELTGLTISESIICNSTDGNNIYLSGTTYGRWSNATSYVTETDVCEGEKLHEYSCGNTGFISESVIVCSYDCDGGACKTSFSSSTTHHSSGGISSYCTPSWTCTEWGACLNAEQTRTCTDKYNCSSTTGKPLEKMFCSLTSTTISAQSTDSATSGTVQSEETSQSDQMSNQEISEANAKSAIWSILILSIVVAGVLGIYFVFVRPHHEAMYSDTERKLEDWISSEETLGYGREQLKEFLLEKGYDEKDVNAAIKQAKSKAK